MMIRWYEGTMVRRYGGTEVRRFDGAKVRRFEGSKVRRFDGAKVRRSAAPPNRQTLFNHHRTCYYSLLLALISFVSIIEMILHSLSRKLNVNSSMYSISLAIMTTTPPNPPPRDGGKGKNESSPFQSPFGDKPFG